MFTYNGLMAAALREQLALKQFILQRYMAPAFLLCCSQQNDYILLSLVKTKNVGHLRDVRRLVVAMSRARLGLYVFGRINLFRNCFELQPAFNLLCKRPNELHLCPNEVRDYKRFKPHLKWIPLD